MLAGIAVIFTIGDTVTFPSGVAPDTGVEFVVLLNVSLYVGTGVLFSVYDSPISAKRAITMIPSIRYLVLLSIAFHPCFSAGKYYLEYIAGYS